MRSFVAGLFVAAAVGATTLQTEVPLGRDFLFRSVKRYLLTNLGAAKGCGEEVIRLEDESGLLRFVYRDHAWVEKNALVEVIDAGAEASRLRVTLPGDFAGRSQLLMDRLVKAAKEEFEGKDGGTEFFHPSAAVFASARRFVLKSFVRPGQAKEEVLKCANEEAGFFRFAYREGEASDPDAAVYVVALGAKSCRLRLVLPGLSSGRKLLLEEKLLRAVREDLGEVRKGKTEEGAP